MESHTVRPSDAASANGTSSLSHRARTHDTSRSTIERVSATNASVVSGAAACAGRLGSRTKRVSRPSTRLGEPSTALWSSW